MSMKRGIIGGDVMLHPMLIRVCRLEVLHKKLRTLVYYGIEGVNAGDVETTDGRADTCNTSRNHMEVIKTDEISTEDGVCDICHTKLLCEGVSLAKYKRCFVFAPCFDERAVGS